MKKCITCHIEKEFLEFSKNKSKKDGHNNMCKLCFSEYSKKYEKTEKRQEYLKSDRRKELHRASSKRFHQTEKRKLYLLEYNDKNKHIHRERKRQYVFNRRHNDDLFRFKTTLRSNIVGAFIKTNNKKESKTVDILGCSLNNFKKYIELKFENWMSWSNFGKKKDEFGRSWELDHIIPLCTAKNKEDIIMLNHYTNFQPLCSKVNRGEKGGKLFYEPKPTPPPFEV